MSMDVNSAGGVGSDCGEGVRAGTPGFGGIGVKFLPSTPSCFRGGCDVDGCKFPWGGL